MFMCREISYVILESEMDGVYSGPALCRPPQKLYPMALEITMGVITKQFGCMTNPQSRENLSVALSRLGGWYGEVSSLY